MLWNFLHKERRKTKDKRQCGGISALPFVLCLLLLPFIFWQPGVERPLSFSTANRPDQS